MALDDDIRILSGVSLFEGFTPDQLRLLAFGAENMQFPAGRELYREGAAADSAFIIVDGEVALFREAGGERVDLARIGTGAILGEFALIAESRRLTGAVALVDTDILKISRRLFRRILEEYPEVAIKLHRRIAGELQRMAEEIEKLAPRFGEE